MAIKRFVFILLLLSFIVTGCGNRGIPSIKQDLMDKKLSVLMLSSASLSEPAKQSIGNALQKWRGANFIAYDWIKDLNTLDDSVITKLKANTYDYIYVIGNELFSSANGLIGQGLTMGKWTLLQSQLDMNGSASTVIDQASFLHIDSNQVESLKNKWIQDLLAQNVTVEWVTRSDRPIPSAWAPSEEADHIILLDNNDQWFQQLSFQTKQHLASWIIFYSPVNEAQLKKAKSIGVSVIDISSALSAELNWAQILDNRLEAMTNHSWKKGGFNYNEKELTELKVK
ncbi:hypothetical protein SAMN04487897_101754 [Paenibacillus sp. yr247]|uniref:hypothetical protein n=1 Tax=Paenibacillus sp. yr247 TaxID=1761880 RepID=UPI0008903BD4|nr:hypothetical protein [Paenibacillus sp. yr247]SDN00037.1 hypothetical protein SAMN04487897_101754 [Paenibacillus sp. yr247]